MGWGTWLLTLPPVQCFKWKGYKFILSLPIWPAPGAEMTHFQRGISRSSCPWSVFLCLSMHRTESFSDLMPDLMPPITYSRPPLIEFTFVCKHLFPLSHNAGPIQVQDGRHATSNLIWSMKYNSGVSEGEKAPKLMALPPHPSAGHTSSKPITSPSLLLISFKVLLLPPPTFSSHNLCEIVQWVEPAT